MSLGHKIRLLFVTATILMLGSHALVPHHHHFDSHHSHGHSLPIESHHHANESENPEYHCHSFNHLLDDGYHHKLTQLIKYQPLVAPPVNEGFPSTPIHTTVKWEISDIKRIAHGYDHLYSLRDPPALS